MIIKYESKTNNVSTKFIILFNPIEVKKHAHQLNINKSVVSYEGKNVV